MEGEGKEGEKCIKELNLSISTVGDQEGQNVTNQRVALSYFSVKGLEETTRSTNPRILFMVVASGKQDQGGAEWYKSLFLAMYISLSVLFDDLTM